MCEGFVKSNIQKKWLEWRALKSFIANFGREYLFEINTGLIKSIHNGI